MQSSEPRAETIHEAACRHVCELRLAALMWKAEHGGDLRSRAESEMWGYVHSVPLEHRQCIARPSTGTENET